MTSIEVEQKPADQRIRQLDILRGIIMIIMSLDHFVYFIVGFHPGEFWNLPPAVFPAEFLFWFRALSHLCAPGFVFLSGVSLSRSYDSRMQRNGNPREIQWRFAKRGAVLILFQLVLEPLAWGLGLLGVPLNEIAIPGVGTGFIYLGVIYAIGLSMVIGSGMIRLPRTAILLSGVGISIASVLLLRLVPNPESPIPWFASMTVVPGHGVPFFTNYPLLPWLGVFLIGMWAGSGPMPRMLRERTAPLSALFVIAVAILASGVLLRFWMPWGESQIFDGTFRGFFTLSKYPPSPGFLLLSIGGNILILALIHSTKAHFGLIAELGKRPLFFYFFHLFFYGILSLIFRILPKFIPVTIVWLLTLVPLFAVTTKLGFWSDFKLRILNRFGKT
jgi:uncharacterized membrane protein